MLYYTALVIASGLAFLSVPITVNWLPELLG